MKQLGKDPWLLALAAVAGCAVLAGLILRVFWLSFPDRPVFDEVYFPVFASDYLRGTTFFDVHPPLGKYLIAIGIAAFGDDKLGGRIIPCAFGIAIIPMFGLLARKLLDSVAACFAVSAFLALDTLFIAYSRTSLMDGILFFAIFGTVWLGSKIERRSYLVWTVVALGLSIAIKWTALATVVPLLWFAYRAGRLKPFVLWLPLAAGLYFAIVLSGQIWQGSSQPFHDAIAWHQQAAARHINLTETHAWGSKWWSWPIMERPVLFLYDSLPDHRVQYMTSLANPILIWSSTALVLFSAVYLAVLKFIYRVEMAGHRLVPLLIGYLSAWLPFAAVHRVMFFYHYMPAYGFALLILAYWWTELWNWRKAAGIAAVVTASAVGWFFAPLGIGYPKLTSSQIDARTWIPSWLNR